ncbi:MAG: aldehyde ferredoxin oxidoreductase family protein [Deltaproteobacteria bacterium]|nr:aldehyde ferredoxin oxidoreductase family protein [Deltaproteobacteria bacterium]
MGGYAGRYLDVDLTGGTIEQKRFSPTDLELYIGGRGLGVRTLYDQTPPGLDPFDEKMVLMLSTGPVTGTNAPQSNRFVVTTKSPLTGLIADSQCGGNFATKLKKAGYDAVLVRGKSPGPVYLEITEERAELKDASHLWGAGTAEAQAALPRKYGKAVIGPAGENRVRYAAIVSQSRVAGRTGTGAVMGSKKLKAIIADGNKPVAISKPDEYAKLHKQITKHLLDHPMTGKILPDLGTANLVMTTAGRNIIPTRNYQAGQDARTAQLSGERMRDEIFYKREGCLYCPIRCGRQVKIGDRLAKGPEFETIGLLGNNLGIFDMPAVVEIGELCDHLGLDTISMGNTLGFATELTERGQLESDLRWGDVRAYRQAIEDTAQRRGLGADLAEGTRRMAEKYGGQDFAIHVKGLELPAYDPRGCVGQGLEYATTSRGGCHIRGSTMYVEATGPVSIDPYSARSKPELVVLQQNSNAAISSLVMCYFSSYAMIPDIMFELDPNSLVYRFLMQALSYAAGPVLQLMLRLKNPAKVLWFEKFLSVVTGRDVSMGELNEIGERIFNLERLYNLREGLTAERDTLPARMLDEPLSRHGHGGVPLREMLPGYYKLRGWDERGAPTAATIRRLGIRT